MNEILADSRFFSSGPVISYRPNGSNVLRLAAPPREMPRQNASPTVPPLIAAAVESGRKDRARASERPNRLAKEICPHTRFTRIADWNPKKGIERVRARCAACPKEKILPARCAELALGQRKP